MKISNKISLYFLIAVMALSALAVGFIYFNVRRSVLKEVYRGLEAAIQSRKNHIETYLEMTKTSVQQLSNSPTLGKFLLLKKDDPLKNEAFRNAALRLKKTKEANPAVFEFFLMDIHGAVVVSSNEENIGIDKHNETYFINGKYATFIKEPYYSETAKSSNMVVSAPMVNPQNNELIGVLAARFKLDALNNIVADDTGMGKTGEMYLVNSSGYMITPSRTLGKSVFLKQKVNSRNFLEAVEDKDERIKLHGLSLGAYRDYLGELDLGVNRYIPDVQWYLIAEIDVMEAFEPLRVIRNVLFSVVIVASLVVWIIGLLLAKIIIVPIRKLKNGMEIVAAGDFSHVLTGDSKDEIGELASAFNLMTEKLRESTTSIESLKKEINERKKAEITAKKSQLFTNAAINALQDIFYVFDKNGKFIIWNYAFLEQTGYSNAEVSVMTPMEFFEGEDIQKVKAAIQKAWQDGFARVEASLVTKNKLRVLYEFTGSILLDDNGEAIGISGTGRVQTDRLQMERTLQEIIEKYKVLYESSADAIMVLDKEGFLDCNPATLKLFRCKSRDEFIHKHPGELSPEFQPDGRPSLEEAGNRIEEAYKNGSAYFEWMHKRVNGENFLSNVLLTRMNLNGENVLQATVRDISSRKQSDEAILRARKSWEDTFNSINDIITIQDKDFNIILANKAAERVLGLQAGDISTKKCYEIFHNREDSMEGCPAREVLRTGIPSSSEIFEPKLGIYVEVSAYPRFDDNNNIIGVIHIIKDITARKKATDELRKLSWIIDSSSEAIIAKDLNGVILSWNKGAQELYGYSREEIVGKPASILLSPGHENEVNEIILRIRRGEHIKHFETQRLKKGGAVIRVSLSISAIEDSEGNIIGVSTIAHSLDAG